MKKIGLVVDEGADLPREIIGKYQIGIVHFKMEWPTIENLLGRNTFQKMREAEKRGVRGFGKTSQPSPKDFLEVVKKQFEIFEKILIITITSKHSGTYNSACQAKNFLSPEEQKRVFVVDSLNASGGEGLLVLGAIDLILKGEKSTEEIVAKLEKLRLNIRLVGMLKDPKWLEASGRISHFLANWIRKMEKIGIRPLIGIKKGVIKAVGIKKGAKDIPTALFQELEGETKKLRNQEKKIRVVITHGDNLEIAQKLKETVEKELKGVEIVFSNLIDDVLSILVGPDSLLFAWCEII
jgi:DegV family protein with EDD domain